MVNNNEILSMSDVCLAVDSWVTLNTGDKLNTLQKFKKSPGFSDRDWCSFFRNSLLKAAAYDLSPKVIDWLIKNVVFDKSDDADLINTINSNHPKLSRWLCILSDAKHLEVFCPSAFFSWSCMPEYLNEIAPKDFWDLDDEAMCLCIRYRYFQFTGYIAYLESNDIPEAKVELAVIEYCREVVYLHEFGEQPERVGDYSAFNEYNWAGDQRKRLWDALPNLPEESMMTLASGLLRNKTECLDQSVFDRFPDAVKNYVLADVNFKCRDIRRNLLLSSTNHEDVLSACFIDEMHVSDKEFEELWSSGSPLRAYRLGMLLQVKMNTLLREAKKTSTPYFDSWLPFLMVWAPILDEDSRTYTDQNGVDRLWLPEEVDRFVDDYKDNQELTALINDIAIATGALHFSDWRSFEKCYSLNFGTKHLASPLETKFKAYVVDKNSWQTYLNIKKQLSELGYMGSLDVKEMFIQAFGLIQIGKVDHGYVVPFEVKVTRFISEIKDQITWVKYASIFLFVAWIVRSIF